VVQQFSAEYAAARQLLMAAPQIWGARLTAAALAGGEPALVTLLDGLIGEALDQLSDPERSLDV
jgi:hypothetical protein